MNKIALYILTLSLLVACTHRFDTVQDNTPAGNFRAMWKIIDEKYCFVEEKNINWDSVYSAYIPLFDTMHISNYRDNYRFFDQLAAPLNQLHDGHVNLYSSFDISSSNEWYQDYPTNFNSTILYKYYLKDYRRASALQYNCIDEERIGYIYLSSFSSSFGAGNINSALNYFASCQGLIIDVRNNGGGAITNAYLLASPFFNHDTIIGYWQHKSGPGHSDFSSLEPMRLQRFNTKHWNKPVVVLCNRHSYSATNLFISLMRYADCCTIVGGRSGGGGGMPLSYELPNGWLIRFSSVKMYDRQQKSIEDGINPNVEVTLTSKDKDDIIETAIQIINLQNDTTYHISH